MGLNAFMQLGKAEGESRQPPYVKWIELQSWDWEVEAETSWTKGGGASVGKPNPGKMNWEHYWDKSSHTILGYICTGTSFDEVRMEMCKSTGPDGQKPFFQVLMKEAFITKVANSATDDGNVLQKVEMVFKYIEIKYAQQGVNPRYPGALTPAGQFDWDIPAGKAHPSTGG
ncbi:MAG: type VI secretion system tube protein Hcp [Caldimonas sp.]